MNKWLMRLLMGLIFGLAGLYFQYRSLGGRASGGAAGGAVNVEGGAEEDGVEPTERQKAVKEVKERRKDPVKGIPGGLLKEIESTQSAGGGRGRSRRNRGR